MRMTKRDARFLSPEAQAEIRCAYQRGASRDEAGASGTHLWCEPLVGGAMDQAASLERSAGTGAQAAWPARWRGGQAQHQTGAAYPCIGGRQNARAVEVALLFVDACGGAVADQARIRGAFVADGSGRLFETLGSDDSAPGQMRV